MGSKLMKKSCPLTQPPHHQLAKLTKSLMSTSTEMLMKSLTHLLMNSTITSSSKALMLLETDAVRRLEKKATLRLPRSSAIDAKSRRMMSSTPTTLQSAPEDSTEPPPASPLVFLLVTSSATHSLTQPLLTLKIVLKRPFQSASAARQSSSAKREVDSMPLALTSLLSPNSREWEAMVSSASD